VECNRTVKFRDLLETARDLGADVLATGPTWRAGPPRRRTGALPGPPTRTGTRATSSIATTPEQLAFLRFPLGELDKAETRALARGLGLAVADKADSQDICFVPQGRYSDIIERLKPGAARPGEVVHLDGRVLGRHEGIIHFTVGQRRGLGLSTGSPSTWCASTPTAPG
jgi:tRNA-specific 2-thiouridylase